MWEGPFCGITNLGGEDRCILHVVTACGPTMCRACRDWVPSHPALPFTSVTDLFDLRAWADRRQCILPAGGIC